VAFPDCGRTAWQEQPRENGDVPTEILLVEDPEFAASSTLPRPVAVPPPAGCSNPSGTTAVNCRSGVAP